MKLTTYNKAKVAAAAVAAAGVALGVTAVVRKVRRRRKRVLKPALRKLMLELLELHGEDFLPQRLPGGGVGKSVFMKRIERLDDKKLMVIFAVVEVGYFLKASGIDPFHPTKEDVLSAAQKYLSELAGAPRDRAALLGELDTSDAHDALAAAMRVLGVA